MTLTRVLNLGFDNSTIDKDRHGIGHSMVDVSCSQCEALVINGTPTHEHGCPNQTFECRGCNERVSRRGAYCEDCR